MTLFLIISVRIGETPPKQYPAVLGASIPPKKKEFSILEEL